jgi:toxin ParE1/3/4
VKRAVVFAPEAQADLTGLYDYIAERDGESRAEGYLRRIEKACMSLETMPQRGTDRSDLRPGLRVMGFERRVLIAFRIGQESVAILRVLYGGRNLELAFGVSTDEG